MLNKNSCVFLFCMVTIFLTGSILFLNGFFPDAYVRSEQAEENVLGALRPTDVKGFRIEQPNEKYKQIILMIVDALRFSFVDPLDSMPYTQMNHCDRLKIKVSIPTVTLPRIKSLMTGTISNFIDIIRNLGESEQLSDSLLHVLQEHKRMVNFIGDRTWTQLFPNEFTRKKANMDSFFVNDFNEGDQAIITTLRDKEINQTDWSLLILHFLGLDHIGHVEGSNSPKIAQKLVQMDNVVKYISENQFFDKRLVLLTGDHGMREGGGHGGSTEEELTVPLLFYNKFCERNEKSSPKEYKQIDLTPTLAILMNVEIPKPSIGCLIPELLTNFTLEERLYAYYYNAHHLFHKAVMKYGENSVKDAGYAVWFEDAQLAHKRFLVSNQKNTAGSYFYEQALGNYRRVADEISQRMSESLVNFDYGLISVGIFLTTTSTIYTIIHLIFTETQQKYQSKSALILKFFLLAISLTIALIVNISSQEMELITVNSFQRNCLLTALLTIGVYISLNILRQIQKFILPLPTAAKLKLIWTFPKLLLTIYLITVCVLASSSFIEFEEKSWHYLGVTSLLILLIRKTFRNHNNEKNVDNIETYLKSFLKQNKFDITIGFIMLITLRYLSVHDFIYNRSWTSHIKISKEFCISFLFLVSLMFLLKYLRKFLRPQQRLTTIGVALSLILHHGFQGKILFLAFSKFGSFLALCSFWIFLLITISIDFVFFISKNEKFYLRLMESCLSCSFLLGALLQQTHNVIMLPCLLYVLEHAYNFCDNMQLQMRESCKQSYKMASKTFLTIIFAQMFFFYQGNSNSLATIDLNPGYIGQSTYNPLIVTIFVTLNTYFAPINAFFYYILHILKNENHNDYELVNITTTKKSFLRPFKNENLQLVMSLYTTLTLIPVAVYLVLMILFRYHLFIYSVFAPKVFYECYRVLVFYLIYCGFYIFIFIFK